MLREAYGRTSPTEEEYHMLNTLFHVMMLTIMVAGSVFITLALNP
jgi:hypothetical protein